MKMHPGFHAWWGRGRGGCGPGAEAEAGCGPGGGEHEGRGRFGRHEGPFGFHASGADFDPSGGMFGVRRPLRFLAYKLDLSDEQVAELARVLDELKIERAQGAVDHRRSSAAFADALSGEALDAAKLAAAAEERVESARRLKEAVTKALTRIHQVLDAKQRQSLAYLIRTGALQI